ncbi:MAG: DUF59 domain-containing protein [Bacteroidales bacterium]|nr:DUF59 domain-containing protein [Bacteroidales bacterium]
MNNMDKIMLEQQIIRELKGIYDPEIPVNIYDLGLIYNILIDEAKNIRIKMTLTAPNCPVAESLPVEVRDKIRSLEGVADVQVEILFDPPWSRDMISQEGLLELGFM